VQSLAAVFNLSAFEAVWFWNRAT